MRKNEAPACGPGAMSSSVSRDLSEAAARAQGLQRIFAQASITALSFSKGHGFSVVPPQLVETRGQKLTNFRIEKFMT